MRATTASLPLVALLALALAACGPTATKPPASPDPSGSATPAPSETEPADPLETVTRIMIQSEIVYFGDEVAWALDGFSYLDDADAVVAKLTTVFGAEPTVTEQAGGLETATALHYDWGGFVLGAPMTSGPRNIYTSLFVRATSAAVQGITIETIEGVTIGSPAADAAAHAVTTMTWGAQVEAQLDPTPVTAEELGEDPASWGGDLHLHVSAWSPAGTGTVTELVAPARNFGS